MKKILSIVLVLVLLFIFSCNGTGPKVRQGKEDPTVDTFTNYFYPKYHKPIAIFPTFKHIGVRSISATGKAYREYNIWKDDRKGKYILITTLRSTQGEFPEDFEWIDRDNAIYSNGNKTAYNSLHERPLKIIHEMSGERLPDCIIVAQEFYFNKKEAMYKVLIVPDEMCAEDAGPIIEELNRVANMQ